MEKAKNNIIKIIFLLSVGVIFLACSTLSYAAYEDSLEGYWKFDGLSMDDTFDGSSINTSRWTVGYSSGGSAGITNNQLRLVKPGTASSNSAVTSKATLAGDFDVYVSYTLVNFPHLSGGAAADYISANLDLGNINGSTAAADWTYFGRQNQQDGSDRMFLRQYYPGPINSNTTGDIRLVRTGTDLSAYTRPTGTETWTQVSSTYPGFTTADVALKLLTFNTANNTTGTTVDYNNLVVASGEQASDSTSSGNRGVIYGATQVAGQHGNALSFDGVSDYVEVADSASSDFGTGDFTLEAWVKTNGSSDRQGIINKRGGGQDYIFWIAENDQLYAYIKDSNGNSTNLNSTATVSADGNWHHVAAVFDRDADCSFYVDGNLTTGIDISTYSGNISPDAPLYIGSEGIQRYFNGSIDDVGIWNRTLDAYEIAAIYGLGTEKFEAVSMALNNSWDLDFTTEEISQLATLYVAEESGVIGGMNFTYYSGNLPGDTDGEVYAIGDSWVDGGKYYIKLGSGFEFEPVPLGGVPELPPFAMQLIVLLFGGIIASCRKLSKALKKLNAYRLTLIAVIFFLVISTMCFAPVVFGATYLGYEEWGGTYRDAEKSPSNTEDDELCWAAASSNLLDWTSWGYAPGESFTGTDDMFGYYQDHWTDVPGHQLYGMGWWFDGINPAQGQSGWAQVDVTGGNFWEPEYEFDNYVHYEGDSSLAMETIDSYLNSGYGVALGVRGPGGHAITVWGFDYDELTGDYLGVHVTDSDDDKGDPTPEDELRYYNVLESGGNWYLQNFYGSNSWYIDDVTALEAMFNDLILNGIDFFEWTYTSEQQMDLIKLYADGKAGLSPDSITIDGLDWTYLSGDLPGDFGGTTYNIGDSWEYGGSYYIKLGSGLWGAPLGGVPELPPFAMQLIVVLFGGSFCLIKRRCRS